MPRLSRTPAVLRRPAPSLGQDQEKLDDWLKTRRGGEDIPPAPSGVRLGEAFASLKVVDFNWVAVGPITAKALADHEATVVRVESETRIDFLRTLMPFKDGMVGPNRSHFMNNVNTSKLGITLNLAMEQGLRLARQLTDWAEMVVETSRPAP